MDKTSIPILKMGNYLITSPQSSLHDRMAVDFRIELLEKIIQTKAKGLIFDVSAIDIVDSFLARQIGEITASAGVMGARVVIVGLRPEVSMTLVEMGITLDGIMVARNLEKGLEALRKEGVI